MKSQSAGQFESVFLGKANTLLGYCLKKMIAGLSLFRQTFRGDWNQRKRRLGPDSPHGASKTLSRSHLMARPLRDDAQVYVAVPSGLAPGMGSEQQDLPHRHGATHRVNATY